MRSNNFYTCYMYRYTTVIFIPFSSLRHHLADLHLASWEVPCVCTPNYHRGILGQFHTGESVSPTMT